MLTDWYGCASLSIRAVRDVGEALMAEIKTVATAVGPADFLAAVEPVA